jgi:hypothetical protein
MYSRRPVTPRTWENPHLTYFSVARASDLVHLAISGSSCTKKSVPADDPRCYANILTMANSRVISLYLQY